MNLGFLTSSLLNYTLPRPLCSRVIGTSIYHGVLPMGQHPQRPCWWGLLDWLCPEQADFESGQGLHDEKDVALGSTD